MDCGSRVRSDHLRTSGRPQLMFRLFGLIVGFIASCAFALWAIQTMTGSFSISDPGWLSSFESLLGIVLGVLLQVLIYVLIAACTTGLVLLLFSAPRIRARSVRKYEAYEIHLTNADEAKPQDREDMMEAIANTVRTLPFERLLKGQRTIGFDFRYEERRGGFEWTPYLLCEPKDVEAIDGVIAGAYLNIRIGRTFGGAAQPAGISKAGKSQVFIARLRKARSFVYAISEHEDVTDAGTRLASPPLEAIALAQVSVGGTNTVRVLLTPASTMMERWARSRYKRHENKLARSETWFLDEAGLRSQLSRKEMIDSAQVQNRSFFFFDIQVAAGSRRTCYDIAGVLAGRRGENRLVPRLMFLRQGLYRQRFANYLGPLLPVPSLRTAASASEISYLVDFPTGRMKAVPVRRVVIPRLPVPPEVLRSPINAPIRVPPGTVQASMSDDTAVRGPNDPAPSPAPPHASAGNDWIADKEDISAFQREPAAPSPAPTAETFIDIEVVDAETMEDRT